MTSKGLARMRKLAAKRSWDVILVPMNGGEEIHVKGIEAYTPELAGSEAMNMKPGFIATKARAMKVLDGYGNLKK